MGMVAYWDFNEGTGNIAHDQSGNNNHGTITGASWVSGISGSALRFEGTPSSYVKVTDSDSLDLREDFTISLWINTEEPSSEGTLLAKYDSSSSFSYQVGSYSAYSGKLLAGFSADGKDSGTSVNNVLSNTATAVNKWYHVVCVHEGTDLMIYVNGLRENTNSNVPASVHVGSSDIYIGRSGLSTEDHQCFKGIIDEVQIWDRALSEEEIENLHTPDRSGKEKIVFTSDRTGNQEVWISDLDGSNQIQLTFDPGYDGYPRLSPNGEKILFISNRDGVSNAWMMNIDGTDQYKISETLISNHGGAWSPDGKRIATSYQYGGAGSQRTKLFVFNADGSNITKIYEDVGRSEGIDWVPGTEVLVFDRETSPNWSPNSELFKIRSDGSDLVRLTHNGISDRSPRVSPCGNFVLFTRSHGTHGYGNYRLYRMDIDGSNVTQMISEESIGGAWSPDGTKFAYVIQSSDWDIHVADKDGNELCEVISEPGTDYQPDWRDFSVNATIDMDPNTLNLKSKGKWVTCYIELPEGYDVTDIDPSTILLEDTLLPILDPKFGWVKDEDGYIMDHDGDGIMERMVKFARDGVQAMLDPGVYNLKVTGELEDGTGFEG
jgi:TolB protein